MNLKYLTDKALLEDVKKLAQTERETTTNILHHLKEIERRKLFCDLGYPSMIQYAMSELGYSETSAIRRINGARLLKELPEIESQIKDGSLSLSNLHKAAGFFRKENIKEPTKKRIILKKIENKSARQCEKTLLELSPQTPLPKESLKLVAPEFSQIKVNLHEETLGLLEEAKCLIGFFYLDDKFLNRLARHALNDIKHRKFKIRPGVQNPDTRYLSNKTKREVFEKSQGVCENCGSLFLLQYDHIEAFALGGKSHTENLRLLCFHCNQRARIKTYNQDLA